MFLFYKNNPFLRALYLFTNMLEINSCCFCIDLKLGTILIGFLELIINLLLLIVVLVVGDFEDTEFNDGRSTHILSVLIYKYAK